MTPRNSRGVFLFPDEPMGIAKVRKSRARKARTVTALEFRPRQIAIAGQVIEPGCARPELQQPSGFARAGTRDVTGHVPHGPKDMSPPRRRRPRGNVIDQYRDAARSHELLQM